MCVDAKWWKEHYLNLNRKSLDAFGGRGLLFLVSPVPNIKGKQSSVTYTPWRVLLPWRSRSSVGCVYDKYLLRQNCKSNPTLQASLTILCHCRGLAFDFIFSHLHSVLWKLEQHLNPLSRSFLALDGVTSAGLVISVKIFIQKYRVPPCTYSLGFGTRALRHVWDAGRAFACLFYTEKLTRMKT